MIKTILSVFLLSVFSSNLWAQLNEPQMRALYNEKIVIVHAAKQDPILLDQAFQGVQNYNFMFEALSEDLQAKLIGQKTSLATELRSTLELAIVNGENKCRNHKLGQIKTFLYWAELILDYPLVGAGMPSHVDLVDKAMACAHFEIRLDSDMLEINTQNPKLADVSGTIFIKPLMKSPTALMFQGNGPIFYDRVQWSSQGTGGCETTAEGNTGEIDITGLDLGFDLGETGGHGPVPPNMPMTQFQVDILMPRVMETVTINCQGAPPFSFPGAFWFTSWMSAHEDVYNENTGTYEFNQWVINHGSNATIATKTYNQTTTGMGDVQEKTSLKLIHTPKL